MNSMAIEKILIVEDEDDIRELVHFHLFRDKYTVFESGNGRDALLIAQNERPDLIILDIMIPELDGISVCRALKENPDTQDIKIIFLSAKGEEEDIVRGLELGAEDYITKPFSPKVLMAKIKTILKRGQKKDKQKISQEGIDLYDDKKKVFVDNREVPLTSTEFQLLQIFISNPGHVYTRTQIVNKIRGMNHAITDRSVDTQLVSLRKKLGVKGKLIETVWGVGYRFKENET